MPTTTMEEEIISYGKLLAEIAGPALRGTHKPYGNQLPYRWEFTTTTEPLEYVTTIPFAASDIVRMNTMNDDQKTEYLRARFAHLFNRP
jgi:hypothetical protein